LVDGLVQGAVVDRLSIQCYQQQKPARMARLQVLSSSQAFPASVIAYREGAIDPATLNQLQTALVHARRQPLGRQFLALWKLRAFEPVPSNYDKTVAAIVRDYPMPKALPASFTMQDTAPVAAR
jgi:ABC-type phosphate/phosphonate transport system substrate-binding protein